MQKLITVCFLAMLSCNGSAQKPLAVGDSMPMFTLRDQDGKTFDAKDYIGKKILVIYFYPKDESPVCTKESCAFRDNYQEFEKAGAMVVGINYAGSQSHKQFQKNDQLPFPLLSDPGNRVLKQFGVKGKFFMTGRKTFVIDKTGKIVFTYDSFIKGAEHSEKALEFVKQMNARS